MHPAPVFFLAWLVVIGGGVPVAGETSSAGSACICGKETAAARQLDASAKDCKGDACDDSRQLAVGRLLGGGAWWASDYEYLHFECYVVAVLVCMAMVFDDLHHRLSHLASHKHDHEEAAQAVVHRESDLSLWEPLFNHCTGELMVLGCVAFIVWVFARAGLFKKIAKGVEVDSGTLPTDGYEYLHTIEDVHMQVFVAMLVYMGTIALVARGVSKQERDWEKFNARILTAQEFGSPLVDCMTRDTVRVRQLEEFHKSRKAFLVSLEDWRGSWEVLDIELEPLLILLRNDYDCAVSGASRQYPDGVGSVSISRSVPIRQSSGDKSLVSLLDPFFPFDHYLSLQSRFLVTNLVQIKGPTWLFIACSQVIKAVLLNLFENLYLGHLWDLIVIVLFLVFVTLGLRQIHQARENLGSGGPSEKDIASKLVTAGGVSIRSSVKRLFLASGLHLAAPTESESRPPPGRSLSRAATKSFAVDSMKSLRRSATKTAAALMPFTITRASTAERIAAANAALAGPQRHNKPHATNSSVHTRDSTDTTTQFAVRRVKSKDSKDTSTTSKSARSQQFSSGSSWESEPSIQAKNPSKKVTIRFDAFELAPDGSLSLPAGFFQGDDASFAVQKMSDNWNEKTSDQSLGTNVAKNTSGGNPRPMSPLSEASRKQLASRGQILVTPSANEYTTDLPEKTESRLSFDLPAKAESRLSVDSSRPHRRPSVSEMVSSVVPETARRSSVNLGHMAKGKAHKVAAAVRVHKKYPWMIALTLLQIVLFSMALNVVRFIIIAYWWENYLKLSIGACVALAVGWPALGCCLGRLIPALAVLIARADFMETRNVEWVSIVIEDHVSGRSLFARPGSRHQVAMSRAATKSLPLLSAEWGESSEKIQLGTASEDTEARPMQKEVQPFQLEHVVVIEPNLQDGKVKTAWEDPDS
jgi:hypothetical protein